MTTAPRASAGARLTALAVLVLCLAGTFTLDRVDSRLPALDLRWIGLFGCLLVFLALRPRATRGRRGSAALVGLSVAWAVWLVASSLWAQDGARVAESLTGLAVLVVVVALVACVAHEAGDGLPDLVQRWWTWWVVVAAVYLLAAVVAGPGAQGRFAAFGGGPNVFVRVMAFGVFASLALGARRRSFLLLAPVFVVGAVLSGSRGGILALLLTGGLAALPLLRRLPPARVAGAAVAAAVAAVGVFAASADVRSLLLSRFVEQTFEDRYDSGRGQIFDRAAQLGLDHPWFGAGLDSYYAVFGRFENVQYPHNLLLAVFADGGVVGLGLLAVGALVPTVVVVSSRSSQAALLAAAGWFVLVASLFSGDLYDSRFAWVFLALATVVARGAGTARRPRADAVRWFAARTEDRAPAPPRT